MTRRTETQLVELFSVALLGLGLAQLVGNEPLAAWFARTGCAGWVMPAAGAIEIACAVALEWIAARRAA